MDKVPCPASHHGGRAVLVRAGVTALDPVTVSTSLTRAGRQRQGLSSRTPCRGLWLLNTLASSHPNALLRRNDLLRAGAAADLAPAMKCSWLSPTRPSVPVRSITFIGFRKSLMHVHTNKRVSWCRQPALLGLLKVTARLDGAARPWLRVVPERRERLVCCRRLSARRAGGPRRTALARELL